MPVPRRLILGRILTMKKPRLMTPGPTPVPEEVLLELARPVQHHRSPEFRAKVAEVLEGLRWLFASQAQPIILTASGTGAMEAAVANLVGPGDRAVVLAAGRFGRRWAQLVEAFGGQAHVVSVTPGESVEPEQAEAALKAVPDAVALFATHCETSTGAAHDLAALGQLARRYEVLFVVDAVSSAGGMPCFLDEWNIDVLVTGSQKGLMCPPGLAFLLVGERAWRRIETRRRPVFYFDLLKLRDKAQLHDMPFTPAHTLIGGLAVALQMLRQEGLPQVWERHERMALACRAGVRALGLSLLPRRPASVVTAVKIPPEVDGEELLRWLRSQYGLRFAGGQDELKGKIFRIAHMGYMDELDVVQAIAALEQALALQGWPLEPGSGLRAAQEEIFRSFQGVATPSPVPVR
jgi:aspartate aminotransferase-like enzyme